MTTASSQAPSGEGVIARLEAASEGSWVLDNAIRQAIGHGYRDSYAYTTSLDAALTLYKNKPERMPTNPLAACIEALKASQGEKP